METIRNSEKKYKNPCTKLLLLLFHKGKNEIVLFEQNKNIYHEDGKNSWDVLNTMPIVHICEAPAQ